MIVHKRKKEEVLPARAPRPLRRLRRNRVGAVAPIQPRGTTGGVLAFLGAGTGSADARRLLDGHRLAEADRRLARDGLPVRRVRQQDADLRPDVRPPDLVSFPGNQGVIPAAAGFTPGAAYQPGNVMAKSGDDTWGIAIKRYITGIGDSVKLIVARTWADYQDASIAAKSLKGSALLLDMDNIDLTYFVGGQTQELRDRQDNDEDSFAAEILSDFTLQVRLMKTHGWLWGLKTASVYS
jgi:hypothetical protein